MGVTLLQQPSVVKYNTYFLFHFFPLIAMQHSAGGRLGSRPVLQGLPSL